MLEIYFKECQNEFHECIKKSALECVKNNITKEEK